MPEMIKPKLLAWGVENMEPGTLEQAARTARLPFVHGHVALMPDAHVGIGATVGSVIPTIGAIIPAAVGVDIGCGMIAVETDATADRLPDDLGKLMPLVEERIPAGVGKGHDQRSTQAGEWLDAHSPRSDLSDKQTSTVLAQFGTLGAGNHFLEVCLDERDCVWVVLHSGSRGIGNQLAKAHIDKAKKLAKRWFLQLEDPDLAYFVQDTPEFKAYIDDMHWAQDYALANRDQMMNEALRSLAELMPFAEARRVNCHHNFTAMEQVCLTCSGNLDSGNPSPLLPSAGDQLARVRGFLGGYRPVVHSCGGLLLLGADDDPVPAPLQDDALAHMRLLIGADPPAPESARNRFSSHARCRCVSPLRTAFSRSNFLSMFGRDFDRLFVEGTPARTMDKVLGRALFGGEPSSQDNACGHNKTSVWVTRKGAIKAGEGDAGVVPGSMGTRSYIVHGKGNPASFNSCSHGAGRRMSRGDARRQFTAADLTARMAGKVWNADKAGKLIDEIPDSYKSIEDVMAAQSDLVEVEHTLRSVLNYKGTT